MARINYRAEGDRSRGGDQVYEMCPGFQWLPFGRAGVSPDIARSPHLLFLAAACSALDIVNFSG